MKTKYLLLTSISALFLIAFVVLRFDEQVQIAFLEFIKNYNYSNIIISLGLLFLCLIAELFFLPYKKSALYHLLHPNKSILSDIILGLGYTLAIFFFLKSLVVLSLVEYFPSISKLKVKLSKEDFNILFVPSLILYLLVADFLRYLYHRLCHELDFAWQIHKFHHAATEFTILSGLRIHPIEHIVQRIFVSLPLILLGIGVEQYLLLTVIILFIDKLQHSMLAWDYGWLGRNIIFSPIGHRIHHSKEEEHWDTNYGDLFVFWDKLFGTYYKGQNINSEVGVSENWMNQEGLIYDLWQSVFLSLLSIKEGFKTGYWRPKHKRKSKES